MWLRDYHLDGLRLDAVHALVDNRALNILEELAVAVDALAAVAGRSIVLVAESDLNNPRLITPRQAGGYGLDAQWNDDFHHSVHALVTGERQGYYSDFGALSAVAKTLTKAYFHDGTWSSFRGRTHGRPVDTRETPAYRFVVFTQDNLTSPDNNIPNHNKPTAFEAVNYGTEFLAPALVTETGMLPGDPEDLRRRVPVGRLGRPEEVADLALAMLRNAYLTNQVVSLDGGMYPR